MNCGRLSHQPAHLPEPVISTLANPHSKSRRCMTRLQLSQRIRGGWPHPPNRVIPDPLGILAYPQLGRPSFRAAGLADRPRSSATTVAAANGTAVHQVLPPGSRQYRRLERPDEAQRRRAILCARSSSNSAVSETERRTRGLEVIAMDLRNYRFSATQMITK